MDRNLQSKAFNEIMNALEKIVTSEKDDEAEKIGKALVRKLKSMGVKKEETKVLLEWARKRLVDGLSEDEQDEDEPENEEDDFED